MNEKTVYWIWLQQCIGEGAKTDEILAYYDDPEEIYYSTDPDRRMSGVFTNKQLSQFNEVKLETAEKIFTDCEELGCGIVCFDSEKYPSQLKKLGDAPLVLYTMGNMNRLKNKVCISIVGTRRASQNGLEISKKLSSSLCRANVVVVSGGAYGIDSAAHLGAVEENGTTVAVLGCGFLSRYRDGISDFRQDIIEKGVIISEYHPKKDARRLNFPLRNRIISGLSLGTVVIEAAEKSGSLITARLASEQGKEVFAVPGNAADLAQMGTIKLIRDGATPVFSALDVLSFFSFTHPDFIDWDNVESTLLFENKEKTDFSKITYKPRRIVGKTGGEIPPEEYNDVPVREEKTELNVSENAKKVYDCFGDGNISIDEISDITNLPLPKVLSSLTELEISGIIKSQPGHIYCKK